MEPLAELGRPPPVETCGSSPRGIIKVRGLQGDKSFESREAQIARLSLYRVLQRQASVYGRLGKACARYCCCEAVGGSFLREMFRSCTANETSKASLLFKTCLDSLRVAAFEIYLPWSGG